MAVSRGVDVRDDRRRWSLNRLARWAVLVGAASALGLALVSPAVGQIVDGTRPNGRAGFYFLPPMVTDPGVQGHFDADLTPEVDICVLDVDRDECQETIAEFDTGGQGRDVITVDVEGESYNAVWSASKTLTTSSNKAGNTRYRLEVFQSVGSERTQLGFADLWVVGKSRDLKGIPAGFVGVVRGSPFTIKFRIQTTTVGRVSVTPTAASVAVGQTQQFFASIVDLHAAPMASVDVTWSTDPTGIATMNPTSSTTNNDGIATTIATADTAGTTTVRATAGGVTSSASLEAQLVPATVTLVPGTATGTVGDTATVTAQVLDQFGNPMSGVALRVERWFDDQPEGDGFVLQPAGSGTTADGAVSNGLGEVTVSYSSSQGGLDGLVACWDQDGDNACATTVTGANNATGAVTFTPDDAAGVTDGATRQWVVPATE